MKIKIEIDVPEYVGGTICNECPFCNICDDSIYLEVVRKYCNKVDYSRMTIKELEENNESKS
jgi:hypothetical protein